MEILCERYVLWLRKDELRGDVMTEAHDVVQQARELYDLLREQVEAA